MKRLKIEKGITLIALIITIIVMLILVGVSVTVALNGGLFSSAKKASQNTQLERDKELALDAGEVEINGKKYSSIADYLAGNEQTTAVYKTKDGTIYLIEGTKITLEDGTKVESLPELQTGDTYTAGDYEYRYNQYYRAHMGAGWYDDTTQNGWGVKVTDTTKESYGEILSNVLGKDVNTLYSTFSNCTNLKVAPALPDTTKTVDMLFYYCPALTTISADIIPDNVTSLYEAFYACSSLTLPDEFEIPAGVTNMRYTFSSCRSITSLPEGFTIPSSVTDMTGTFTSCTALESLPAGFTIPENVEILNTTFSGCTSLTSLPENFVISSTVVTDMWGMFNGCTALESLPARFTIPEGVDSIGCMFRDCTSLASLPTGFTIPSSVTDIGETFDNCTVLTGTIIINCNNLDEDDDAYYQCFANTEKEIILTTTLESTEQIELLKAIAATGKNLGTDENGNAIYNVKVSE